MLPATLEQAATLLERPLSAAAGRQRRKFMPAPSRQRPASPQTKATLHFFLKTTQLTVPSATMNDANSKMQSLWET